MLPVGILVLLLFGFWLGLLLKVDVLAVAQHPLLAFLHPLLDPPFHRAFRCHIRRGETDSAGRRINPAGTSKATKQLLNSAPTYPLGTPGGCNAEWLIATVVANRADLRRWTTVAKVFFPAKPGFDAKYPSD
eukprot:909318-Prorocentrum_minimum.AAC.1